ncbi:MAG: hypothetical protein ACRCUC_07320, partial [Aestuariivirga sp.]
MADHAKWREDSGETVMAKFEVQGPDGKIYEVEAPSMEAAAEAIQSFGAMPKGGVSANPKAVAEFGRKMTVLGANASNAMALGLGDEFQGVRAGVGSLLSGGEFGSAYRKERDVVRGDMATINEVEPKMALTGNLVGGAIPALTLSPLAIGRSLLGTGLRGLGIGAAEGALQGAGNADGRGLGWETTKGALIGGGAGLAAPLAVAGLGVAKNLFKEGLPQVFGKASASRANRAIAKTLSRSGKTAPDLDALLAAAKAAGQPEYRLVDALGLSGQRALNGIARSGGAPGDEVAEFLATRPAGQPERVGSCVDDAFGVGGTTAAKTKEGLISARGEAADVA